ncbi:MAG: glycosyltransferase family 4 protein [Deltaproteobacteria bacterium]|nr:glycosyltransferase family 4 protein [Deltaproteobacteria bacterium]
MNILLITQYFWPEEFRINELSRMLADKGYQITVLTGIPNYPVGSFFPGYGFFRKKTEYYGGIKIIRVPLLPRGKGGGFRLALNYFSFAFLASILGPFKCRDQYDVIFVYEPSPITVGLPAIVMKKIKSVPIVFWVQDLWPESLSATGAVKSPYILKMVEHLVKFIYSCCDLILVQSRVFINTISSMGIEQLKIKYFPNSAEGIFSQADGMAGLPQGIKFPEGFCVMFAGNIGAAQDFETILTTAELTKNHADIHWVIVGDGRMFSWLQEQVKIRQLSQTVHLLGRYPVETMPSFFSRADVMLVTLRKEPIFALTVPSKVQAYMASARPIIAALDGEGASIIEEAEAGLVCPSENAEMLAENVIKVYHMDQIQRKKMAMNGRKYFEENFESNKLINDLEYWLIELTGHKV